MSSAAPSMRRFNILLASQCLAMFTTTLTGFSLGVWAYQQAGSVTLFSLIALANTLPLVLLSPIAGTVVDRYPRKRVLVAGQTLALCLLLTLALLHWQDWLSIWHIIAINSIGSAGNAFVMPTIAATVPLMVPKQNLTRANGLIALATGLVQLAAPAAAGTLMVKIGLDGLFVISLCGIGAGLGVLLLTQVPDGEHHGAGQAKPDLASSLHEGWRYLRDRPGLMCLIAFYMVVAFNIYAINMLITPMVLGFTDAQGLGLIASITGLGMILGGILSMSLSKLQRKMQGVYAASLAIAFAVMLLPVWPRIWSVSLFGLLALAAFPVVTTCAQTIFQLKVPNHMQGRVFGLRNFLIGSMQPLAMACAGPLADTFFEPQMRPAGNLAASLGPLFGTGAGRGVAVMISCLGLLIAIASLAALWVSALRNVETDLPDMDAVHTPPAR